MAFFGTKCVEGKCKGVVVLTGPRTIIGRIASLAQSAEQGETTLATDLSKFMKLIGWIAVSLGVLFFCLGFVYNNDVITNFVYAIGIIVANVPEGLLITLTITLAATAARLAQNNVLVKNLQSVETLGSTSCICSDKTGTLTQNRMTPAHALVSLRDFECGLGKDEYELALKNKRSVKHIMYEDSLLQMFAKYLILCSAVEISEPSNDDLAEHIAKDLGLPGAKDLKPEVFEANKEKTLKKIIATTLIKERKTAFGNPTEAGMIKFVSTFMDYLKIRKDWPLAFEIPFSSALKYNVMIRRVQSEMDKSFQRYVVILKGASERVLKRCDKIFVGGSVVPMTEEQRKAVDRKNTEFASNGERVLGLAYMDLDPAKYNESFKFSSQGDEPNFPTTKLVFLGLMSLMDPPRVDVEKSVDKCREAGIKVIMVTGDQPETAKAIAHQCHIITDLSKEYGNMMKAGMSKEQAEIECQAMVIHGDEVAIRHKLDSKKLPDDPEKDLYLQQWLRKKEVVFARMNPAQKLIIVDACQKLGHIVTVTGDGVNDSPALEKANIGIAMGSGSDVAKDVADMVLLTDDFTSIVIGVEQGRLIFDNLKKSIVYTLASNIPELVPFLLYIVLQIPLPLTTILILFIDVGTDLWPAISFAYEGPELDIMKRKPRIPDKDLLVSRKVMIFAYLEIGIIEGFAGMFAYFTVMHDYGFKPMNLFFFAFEKGCESPASDTRQYDWTTTDDRKRTVMDFYSCAKAGNLKYAQASYYVPVSDTLDTVSSVTNEKVRYTSEALRYAQSSFWVAIVITQWADLLICKTRSLSLAQHGFNNMPSFYGLIFETALAVVIMYVPFLHEPLGTRPLDIRHLGVNVFPFFTIIILYDEARKYLMHKFSDIRPGKRPVYAWLYRNTFY